MKDRTKNILVRTGSFVLAGGLLYLALRGVDFDRVVQDLEQANYWYMIPIVAATLGTHWLRAWRWTFLLAEIPEREHARPVRTGGAFAALMIGYLANYAAPRVGEFVRTGNVATRYKRGFAAVFGTVVTERVFDVFTMAVALLTLPLVFSGQIEEIWAFLVEPAREAIPALSPLVILGAAVLVALAGFGVYRYLKSGHLKRLTRTLLGFASGLTTILKTPRRVEFLLSTVVIWLLYGAMAYLPFLMFGFDDTFGMTFVGAWGIMLLGAIGVVIPSPGGFGSYHYITIQSLVLLFGFSQDAAASYAILTHTGQLLIYVVTGAVFILGLGFTLRTGEGSGNRE